MQFSKRTFNALYELAQVGLSPPGAGGKTVTPEMMNSYIRRATQASRLLSSILAEVPPHADRDPRDLASLLREAYDFLIEIGRLPVQLEGLS
jgi:hypothetical protein